MMTRLGRGCRQIVSIYGACFRQPHMALVYQYIPGGDLYSRIHDKNNPPLTYLEVAILACVVAPLKHLPSAPACCLLILHMLACCLLILALVLPPSEPSPSALLSADPESWA